VDTTNHKENKMKKALIVKPSGEYEVKEFDDTNSLSTLQNAVGGLVQPIDILDGRATMWLNEEFLLLPGLEENIMASAIYEQEFNLSNQRLLGNAIFTGGTDENGFTLGLNEQMVDLITQMAEYTKMLQDAAN
jgi:hypothetical protein